MKKILSTLVLFSVSTVTVAFSQVVAWDTNGLSANAFPYSATTENANVSSTSIIRGSGLANIGGTPPGNVIGASGWAATSEAAAVTASDFMQWSVTPDAGFSISYSSIDANLRRTASGASNIRFYYSLDGFSTAGTALGSAATTFPNNTNGVSIPSIGLSLVTPLQGVTSTVTFRMYGWGESGSSQSLAFGRLTGDDLVIGGTVSAIPEPSSAAILFGGVALAGAVGLRRRRRV